MGRAVFALVLEAQQASLDHAEVIPRRMVARAEDVGRGIHRVTGEQRRGVVLVRVSSQSRRLPMRRDLAKRRWCEEEP